jgi:flagellar biosynthesis protein FlhF
MMNIQRFIAPTSREALAKARMAFGEGTLILSNKPTASGVEVMATAENALSAMGPGGLRKAPSNEPRSSASRAQTGSAAMSSLSEVEEDTEQLAMSTLSFQDYVRERMLRRRKAGLNQADEPPQKLSPRGAPGVLQGASTKRQDRLEEAGLGAGNKTSSRAAAVAAMPTHVGSIGPSISKELQAMKEMIEDRFNTMSWLGQAKQNPTLSNMMLKMLRAGYSPALARTILERMPETMDAGEGVRWVMDVLERNLKTDAGTTQLHQDGGVYAMIGSTGVGKTTTAAKLAGLCARQFGASSVGLITLDTYRIGAHEQLRHYGRMLGIVAHLAHDRAALQDLLNLLSNKKMVLIDTSGVAPRDPLKNDMLEVLDIPHVTRLLVLNASNHGDTLDDVIGAFRGNGVTHTVLSKIDEAVKLGPALDAAIRHQLVLRGVTTGQKVPEDWESADADKLVRLSMKSPPKSSFDPQLTDLGYLFNNSAAESYSDRYHA